MKKQITTCNSFRVRSSTKLVCTTTNGFFPLMANVYAFGTGLCRTYRSGASMLSIAAASVINLWSSESWYIEQLYEPTNVEHNFLDADLIIKKIEIQDGHRNLICQHARRIIMHLITKKFKTQQNFASNEWDTSEHWSTPSPHHNMYRTIDVINILHSVRYIDNRHVTYREFTSNYNPLYSSHTNKKLFRLLWGELQC